MAIRIARPVLLNSWVNTSAGRARAHRLLARYRARRNQWDDIHDWLDEHAAGKSFVDVGGMWGDTWAAFEAEHRGASPVTMLDLTAPTDSCLTEQERRGTHVRFVTGDLHDEKVIQEVGMHDIVLCSGVLYHVPDPCLTLERLRMITGDYLILATQATQEIPGIPQACVFYPCLSDKQRMAFGVHVGGPADGLTTRFDPSLDYNNWWWGMSRSALRAMFEATGWEVVDDKSYANDMGYIAVLIARPIPNAPIVNRLSEA